MLGGEFAFKSRGRRLQRPICEGIHVEGVWYLGGGSFVGDEVRMLLQIQHPAHERMKRRVLFMTMGANWCDEDLNKKGETKG